VKRHLILVGLPGSGKTTVGRLVAGLLHAAFVDIDARIVTRAGRSIDRIFADLGEPGFRKLERAEMELALDGPPSVVAPGGGWVAQPGALGTVSGRGLLVYLETEPATATRRAAPAGTRPLLRGDDPTGRMRELLEAREVFYAQADCTVVTEGRNPRDIAADLAKLARTRAGW
jgi:shikimate kinase